MKYIYIIVYGVSLQFDRHILYLLLHIFSLTIMFQSEWNIIQLMSLRNLHKYFICKTRSLHEVCMKLCIRKENWWGRKNRGDEKAKEGERQKERISCLVIRGSLSKTPLQTLCFNDSSHVRNKLRRWWSFHLLPLASLLPQHSWSAVGIRRGSEKERERQSNREE